MGKNNGLELPAAAAEQNWEVGVRAQPRFSHKFVWIALQILTCS